MDERDIPATKQRCPFSICSSKTYQNSQVASDYIQIRNPVYVTHSAGRYAIKRFRKASCPIIERLTNSMMMNGRNNGKKLMAVRIVSHCFEIVCPPTIQTCASVPELTRILDSHYD